MKTLYDELDVAEDASEDEIRKAYHRMMIAFHPDNYHGDPGYARQKTVRVKRRMTFCGTRTGACSMMRACSCMTKTGTGRRKSRTGRRTGMRPAPAGGAPPEKAVPSIILGIPAAIRLPAKSTHVTTGHTSFLSASLRLPSW